MKIKSLVIASAFAGVLFSSASAITTAPAAAPVKFEKPAPLKTIEPIMVPSNHPGSTVNLRMTIDKNGKPSDVRVENVNDQRAYKSIIATVSQWEFKPARKNGEAVSSRVALPLVVKGL